MKSALAMVTHWLLALNRRIDDIAGAGGLAPHVRKALLRQQLASIAQMTPALFVSGLVVSLCFVMLTWGRPQLLPTLLCGLLINALYLRGVLLTRRPAPQSDDRISASALWTVLYCMVLGMLWGAMLNILPVDASLAIQSAAIVGVGGLLCITMTAVVNYPQAMLGFAVPLVVGAMLSLAEVTGEATSWIQVPMILGVAIGMTIVSLRHAAAFVAHRAAETQVAEKREIIGMLLREFEQTTSDWIWGFDEEGRINRISAGFTTATGVSEAALTGAGFVHFLQAVTPPDDPLMAHLEADIAARQAFRDIELRVIADGRECWWTLTGKPAFDESGWYLGYIGTGSDVTERRTAERRITSLAHHDPLTGLLNRTKFVDQLSQCVSRLERYGAPFALLVLDLNQFKQINDRCGHQAGDSLLEQVARRIEGSVRTTDLAARIGGDEFAVILPGVGVAESVAMIAGRLISAINLPYLVDGREMQIGTSIGIALAPVDGHQHELILRNADIALKRAKSEGRSAYRFFESGLDALAGERRQQEAELRDAIDHGELVLHYQPLVSALDGQPTGFEALLRWNHKTRGLVRPADFIPLAEQSGLIVEIGDWSIAQACLAAASWPAHLSVAVNLSSRHFRRSDIAMVIQRALSISGIAPERLEIELTEGLLMESPDGVAEKLAEIHALGVTIALDDFGSGYASLSYLLQYPIGKIKIDRAFVAASNTDAVARDTLKAIALMGKTLKLKITAEGVETREQAELLSGMAYHQLQGFYFARPIEPADLPHYLLTHVPTRTHAARAEVEEKLAELRA